MISTLRRGLLVLLAALPLVANAVAAPSAHELVQDTTNRLLADLAAKGRFQVKAVVNAPGLRKTVEKVSLFDTTTGNF